MRRIARAAALMAALILIGINGGCRTIHAPWSRTTTERPDRPLDEPQVRTSRDAVSDAVMLRDRATGGYADSPSGP